MSRTKRKILSRNQNKEQFGNPYMDEVDDSAAKHRKYPTSTKIKPYSRNFPEHKGGKHKPFDAHGFRNRTGNGARLNRRNTNRSFKKSYRQELEKQLKKELDEMGIS